MIIPPLILHIRIRKYNHSNQKWKKGFFIVLPLFILIPFIMILAIIYGLLMAIILPICLIRGELWGYSMMGVYLYELYCSLKGFRLSVKSEKEIIKINIY